MGFLSKLRNRGNMPTQGKRPSSPRPIRQPTRPGLLSRAPKKLGIPSLPQNLDFLSRLPPNMMPEVDFSNLPQMAGNPNIPAPDGYELRENEKGMNYFREQLSPEDQSQNMLPRRLDIPFQDFNLKNMRPGFVAGGPLIRGALAAGRNIPGRAVGQPGQLTTGAIRPGQILASARGASINDNLRRGTEAAVGALGVGAIDATQGFSEEASRRNMMFNSPEQMGKDLAGLKIGFDQVMQIATNKAQEIGAAPGEYVDRVSRAYGEEMENQRMQEMDAQQGMQPFSVLTGPNMPLRRPEPTEGRTTSDIDDLLSSMEKKN